jgi:hypothetical protein
VCSALVNEPLFSAHGFKFLALPLVQMEVGICPFPCGDAQPKNLGSFLAWLSGLQ